MYLKYLMHAKRRRIKGDVVISNMHSCFQFYHVFFKRSSIFMQNPFSRPLFYDFLDIFPVSKASFSRSSAFFSMREI